MVTGRITVDAELLSAPACVWATPRRLFCAARLPLVQPKSVLASGSSEADTAAQWNTLVKITAITGVAPRAVNDDEFDTARAALTAAYTRRGRPQCRQGPSRRSCTACS